MATSDMIALGIVLLCTVLALLGVLKWLFRAAAGLALGLVLLLVVGLAAEHPGFDRFSRGIFNRGVVIPAMRNQVRAVLDQDRDDSGVEGQAREPLPLRHEDSFAKN